ncbi:homoserine kinase [Methylobacterium sp. 4-46]|uniref:Homoserine kinase n=1 Tax=Methylobacterium sp. (strain 4-46) TaxID=426117 RepID=KHSE_METS4|nr:MULTISPECIES: homoserine kinase [Methylobacterium]B0UKH0.1 RecName: Full=Homoserine kinase; Short=HK; Short=HSK [Methylobacterium sp. 4-46]ACA20303.1 homoserine kinase [Methylobacterium sp. 4-46]WFT79477.1 homoserine kinase [Methylobacterium nodulans]
MAVYTEVPDEALAAFLADYDIGGLLSYKGIAEGVENTNFYLHTTVGSYILTLYEKRVAEGDLPFFLGLMEHLAARGLACPQPIRNRAGTALGRLCGRPAVIVSFLDGVSVRRPGVRHCRALGRALAGLHAAGVDFPMRRPNALSVAAWRPLFAQAEAQADRVAPNLAARTRDDLARLEEAWPRDLPGGVIHADLFTDNVFFIGDAVSGLIDFYFACTDAFAYDLAICLNAWCFELDGSFNRTKGQAMIAAYQAARPLDPREVESLPLLARGAALRFMLTRLVDWLNVPPGALVKPKDPLEYDRKLAFHRRVTGAEEYGWTP